MSSESLPPFPHAEFQYTQPPNPTFTFGQRVDATERGRKWIADGEKHGFKTFQIGQEDPRQMYQLMKSGIVPRPIAFISSVSEDGVENIAPFSFFNQVCPDPPVVSFCCASNPRFKDTPSNVKATKGYTINIISEPWTEQGNMGSIDAPEGVSEWEICGLTKEPSTYVKAPRVKESAFSMECEFLQAVEIINPKTQQVASTMILGTVKYIHVRNDMFNARGIADAAKLKPVARLGDISFASIGPGYRMPQQIWSQEIEAIKDAMPDVY